MVIPRTSRPQRRLHAVSAFAVDFGGIEDAIVCNVAVANSDDSVPKFTQCRSLWDTGAAFSVISKRLVDALGADPIDQGFAYTVQGTYRPNVYMVDVMLPNKMLVRGLRVSDGVFEDADILIGMDIIKLGDLMVSNRGNTRFTFRIPAEGDFTAATV